MNLSAAVILCLAFSCCLGFEDKTIVEWLSSNGNYNTLVTAVSTTGLSGALSGPFTVFAPTDTAFNKLGGDTINNLLQNPNQLADILKYHVVGEFVVLPMINTETNKTTLEGGQLNLVPSSGGLLVNGNSRVSSNSNDIIVNNGVIQPIDTVLMPANNLPSMTIAQLLIAEDSKFMDLNMAIYFTDLTPTLESGDYTLFAPVDDVWVIPENVTSSDLTQPGSKFIYQQILKYHIVPGALKANQLTDGQILPTLLGPTLAVTVNSAGVIIINNSTVIDADLMCTNGVVHALNRVLFPEFLLG